MRACSAATLLSVAAIGNVAARWKINQRVRVMPSAKVMAPP